MSRRVRQHRGFTLIELVVSIAVGAIISGSAAMLLLNASRQRGETAARAELVDTAGVALESIIRYVREVSQNECPADPTPCLLGNAQIDEAGVSTIRFDGIGFRINGTTIEMTNNDGTNWHPLLRNASGLTFTYYDRDGATLNSLPLSATNRAAVRRVTVEISTARGSETLNLRTGIYLRAFMDEVLSDP